MPKIFWRFLIRNNSNEYEEISFQKKFYIAYLSNLGLKIEHKKYIHVDHFRRRILPGRGRGFY